MSKLDDPGQHRLLAHIGALENDAREGMFHDFASSLAAPKVALVERLNKIIENVKEGDYDN